MKTFQSYLLTLYQSISFIFASPSSCPFSSSISKVASFARVMDNSSSVYPTLLFNVAFNVAFGAVSSVKPFTNASYFDVRFVLSVIADILT